MIATTRPEMSVSEPTLYVAFELGKKDWTLAMTSGFGIAPWLRTVASGDLGAVERVLEAGRLRFGLAASARVVSCYEAGRDGFWIHRALQGRGIANRVVDSASIEVKRRGAVQNLSATLGREVRAELPGDQTITGTALDIDSSGRLVVGDHALTAGDIVHVR